jgi:hypothetical protein
LEATLEKFREGRAFSEARIDAGNTKSAAARTVENRGRRAVFPQPSDLEAVFFMTDSFGSPRNELDEITRSIWYLKLN